ncbi:hypothetical protein COC54_17510 [Bacillus pseudomycoides]|nr:hypothetical protein CN564_03240 [Bacillus pseudomycoides]PGS03246.1 hypothetical protein COC54_17510 [Bacillus pseudomycoides]PHC93268.1 hypothetical protein COF36_16575 [Bacillus pseudomycoides]
MVCCRFFDIQITALKTKANLHSFSLFVFTRHGAKKGTDRFYAWLDALFLLKRKGLCPVFNLYKKSYMRESIDSFM